MTTTTVLAMSTGALVAIIIGATLPIFIVVLHIIRNAKKES
jgi:hypothetical protein